MQEPLNPSGRRQNSLAWTNPVALALLGLVILALGAYAVIVPLTAGDEFQAKGPSVVFGVIMGSLGAFMMYLARRRYQWRAWQAAQQASKGAER